jgi:hypothetical protein
VGEHRRNRKREASVALLESKQASESKAFKEFIRTFKLQPEIHVIGKAQAVGRNTLPNGEAPIIAHRPGRAVGHFRGQAGTLGLYVSSSSNSNVVGFCSASHVLLWSVRDTSRDTPVLSPAPPPERLRNDANTYGRYMAGKFLVPYTRPDAPDITFNSADIAWAYLERPGDFPDGNFVPDPQNSDSLVKLRGILMPEELKERVFARREKPFRVFKIGQSSGFTAGEMFACFGTPKTVNIRRESYLYDDYCVIAPHPPFERFSLNGDSGAVVYTEDLMAVGFVVAGTSHAYTLAHVAHECLSQIAIEPLI